VAGGRYTLLGGRYEEIESISGEGIWRGKSHRKGSLEERKNVLTPIKAVGGGRGKDRVAARPENETEFLLSWTMLVLISDRKRRKGRTFLIPN